MDAQLTIFDMKFLSDCGVAVDESTPDKDADRADDHEMDEDAIYYRRIVSELG